MREERVVGLRQRLGGIELLKGIQGSIKFFNLINFYQIMFQFFILG